MANGCQLTSQGYCSVTNREECTKKTCKFFGNYEDPSIHIEDPILHIKREMKELSNVLVANEKWTDLAKITEIMQKIDQSSVECRTGFSSLLLAYKEGLELLRNIKGG